jgi:serine phosphatase RsbU (regulator of sigma subunit)
VPDDDDDELRQLRLGAARDAELIADLRGQLACTDHARVAADTDRTAKATLAESELELDDLRAVRDALTPAELPVRPGLKLTASFQPATQRVSGDFYLAAPGSGDTTVIVVGDVVGKGVEAARDAAFLRAVFASIARFSDDPCRLLAWANPAFRERVRSGARFATAACLTFDPATRRLRWALAGHPTPLRLGSGEELPVGRRGAPLAVRETVGCVAAESELAAGDGVLLYTDGMTEARRDRGLFGVERAQEVIRDMDGRPSSELLSRLSADATAFCGGQLADDLCLVALQGT